MRNKMEALGWFTAFVGMIGLFVFSPVLTFGLAWLGGWILKVCVGSAIADGMNLCDCRRGSGQKVRGGEHDFAQS